MKIWIDGYEANVKQRLGSSQVAFELIKNLEKIDKKNDYLVLLPSTPLEDLPKQREGFRYQVLKPKRLWTKIALPLKLLLTKEKPDIFFSPTHYIPSFSSVKKVVTIFDLSFLRFPESFLKKDLWQLKNWTKYSVENSQHIITISNSTKRDIVSSYKISKNNITVAYPGYDQANFKHPMSEAKNKEVKNKYSIGNNYIIYIGTVQPRKNLIRLIEAVKRIENLELVVVGKMQGEGKEGWMYEETIQTPRKLGIEDKIKFLGFVPLEDLPYLLSGSKAFILPSLWEGFGIPAVEAMACGAPVIVSNVSSLPEVVGKAGLLIDPYSIDQIEQAIRTIISDKKLQSKCIRLGLIQSKKFSWEKMARVTLKVFNKLVD